MRKIPIFLVSALTVLAFAVTPTPVSATTASPQGLWNTPVVPPCIAVTGDPCGVVDANSYELGVKFQTSMPIYVVGVRFYRTDAGMLSGSLWNYANAAQLRSGTVATPVTGWQDVTFNSPVLMTPGQTFIASYAAPNGGYAWQHGYFTSSGLTVGPVTALKSGVLGPNGVFSFDPSNFPTDGFMESNYWVTPLWIPQYTLAGFYQPVDMGGVFNTVKGGSTVPLKFQVFDSSTGVEQTDVSVVDRFDATAIQCPSGTLTADQIEVTTTGGTSLRYDFTAGQFIQNWKTPKKPGACYQVSMFTTDGSSISAKFQLK